MVVNGLIWTPDAAKELRQRIFIVAHCGGQGHRGLEPMFTTIKDLFSIAGLEQHCRQFLKHCLLCKHVKGANVIQRPWGPTNATERNELFHWDFLYLGDSVGKSKYLLVLKDSLTHFCELVACGAATRAVAASAMVDWSKRFGAPKILISDQGSHFKNEVVKQVCRQLAIEQDLVLAYAPWINGTIERLNRDILQVLRVLLVEMNLDWHEWEYLVPMVQGVLNHTPVASLGNRSPGELFTALPRPTPFEPVVVERNGVATVVPRAAPPPAELVSKLQHDLAGMHRDVEDIRERRRLQNMARSNGTPCNFSTGDYVLWSRIDSRLSVNKLLARWVGPFEVVEEHPHAFLIRHLIPGQHYMVHGSRLKFYCDASLGASEEMLAHVGNQGMVLGVEELKDHRKEQHGWQLLVSWIGLQEEENSWESLQRIYDDLPVRVRAYVTACDDQELMEAFSEIDHSFRA